MLYINLWRSKTSISLLAKSSCSIFSSIQTVEGKVQVRHTRLSGNGSVFTFASGKILAFGYTKDALRISAYVIAYAWEFQCVQDTGEITTVEYCFQTF